MSKEQDKLVTDNIGYVVTMAKQYAGRGVPMDDLISEGNMAMVDASRKFEADKGKRFVSYAAPLIRHAMEEAIERQAGLYRVPRSEATRETKRRKMPVSVDEPIPIGSATGFSLLSLLVNKNVKQADLSIEDEQTAQKINNAIAKLDDREREVVSATSASVLRQTRWQRLARLWDSSAKGYAKSATKPYANCARPCCKSIKRHRQ